MGIYSSRNSLATEHFTHEVLKYCEGRRKPPSITHRDLSGAGVIGLILQWNPFGERSLM